MGFMDKLKEIGLGNTGPRGNMNSGATNYANYAKERQSTEAQRGISQALALASKNGKQMPYTVFTDIAKKWNVPVEMVAEPGRNINAGNYRTEVKNQSRDFMEALKIKKDEEAAQGNPKWVPDEGWITNYGMDNGIYPETRGILKDWAVKDKEAKRTKLSQGDVLVESLTGKKIASNEKPPTEDKTMVDVTSPDGTRTASIPRKHLQKYLKAGYTEGKVNTPAGGGKPTDFDKAYAQWIKIPGNEKVTRAAFTTGPNTTPTGGLTDNTALEILQNHALTMDEALYPQFVKEYNAHRKDGMSRSDAMEKVISQDRSAEAAIPYPAAQHKGKVIVDQESGKKYKSDGTTWIETK